MNKKIGYLLLILWILALACSRLLVHLFFASYSIFTLGIYTFLIAEIVFILLWLLIFKPQNKSFSLGNATRKNLKNIFIINISSLGAWLVPMYALQLINPTLSTAMVTAFTPFLTLISFKQSALKPLDWFFALLLFAIGIFIALYFAFDTDPWILLTSLIAALCIGLSAVATKKLYANGFTPQTLLPIRFILIVMLAVIYFAANPSAFFIDYQFMFSLMALACIYVVVPIMLIQFALRDVAPITTSFFLPILPFVVAVLELFFWGKISEFILLTTLVSFVAFLGALYRYKTENRTKN